MDNTAARIMDAGGSAVTDLPGERAMLVDRQGTHFMVQAIVEPEHRDVAPAPAITTGTAWKSALALICFWGVVFLDIRVFWAVLFLFWSWLALRSGQAYVVKPIDRHTQPMLY